MGSLIDAPMNMLKHQIGENMWARVQTHCIGDGHPTFDRESL